MLAPPDARHAILPWDGLPLHYSPPYIMLDDVQGPLFHSGGRMPKMKGRWDDLCRLIGKKMAAIDEGARRDLVHHTRRRSTKSQLYRKQESRPSMDKFVVL